MANKNQEKINQWLEFRKDIKVGVGVWGFNINKYLYLSNKWFNHLVPICNLFLLDYLFILILFYFALNW